MLTFVDLGEVQYSKAFEIQKEEKKRVLAGQSAGTIYFLEHNPPVITIGLNAGNESILYSETFIRSHGYEISRTTRGGDVTVHEPGQLVVYFVLPLKRRGVRSFVEGVVNTVNMAIAEVYGIDSSYNPEKPGLYVADRKLCSIGFDLRGGVSMHGVAININNTLKGFKLINPCGYKTQEMTSIQNELGRIVDIQPLKNKLSEKFTALLEDNFQKNL